MAFNYTKYKKLRSKGIKGDKLANELGYTTRSALSLAKKNYEKKLKKKPSQDSYIINQAISKVSQDIKEKVTKEAVEAVAISTLSFNKSIEAYINKLINSIDIVNISDEDKSIHILKAYEVYMKLASEVVKKNNG